MSSGGEGSIIISLGPVHGASANREIREFKVQILAPHMENEDKEEILENLRDVIKICWKHGKVSQVVKEEAIE